MKTLYLDLIQLSLILTMGLDIFGEPFVEQLMGVEEVRHHEVEQSPQLSHVILDRSTSQQETVPGLELFQGIPSLRKNVLDGLSFVQNHELPF